MRRTWKHEDGGAERTVAEGVAHEALEEGRVDVDGALGVRLHPKAERERLAGLLPHPASTALASDQERAGGRAAERVDTASRAGEHGTTERLRTHTLVLFVVL